MNVHELRRVQRLPLSREKAWAFFSNPHNLPLITPDWLTLRVTNDVPEAIHPGLIITYRVRPLFGIPVRWITEITHAEPPRLFVDEQRFGPFRFWHHQHHLRAVEGGVEVTDHVHYALPFGPIGALARRLVVKNQLQTIFDYRQRALVERFGTLG